MLPLGDLQTALKQDGAPPLYYLLLHGWTAVFGTGNFAVRSLSGVISVATLPLMWLAGRRLGRPGPPGPLRDDPPSARMTAFLALVVMATAPFAIRYATESRMYALVMFEVTLGYLVLRRALERPSLLRLAFVALVVAAMLYTQYWSIYLLIVLGVAMLWRVFRAPGADDRHASRGIVVGMFAGVILFSPWVPTFLFQRAHTGTPWGDGQVPFSSFRLALDQFSNGTSRLHTQANLLAFLLIVLLLLGLFGAAVNARRIDVDVYTQPAVRWEFLAGFVGLGFGLTVAWIGNSAFDGRYASIVFPLFMLVVAFGFMAFASLRLRVALLVLVVLLGFWGAGRNVTDSRTQAGQVAAVLHADAKPGDVVVYCPDQLGPAVNRLVSDEGLDQVTFPNFDPPALIDWVDYRARLAATDPAKFAKRVLDQRADDHTLWFVFNPSYEGYAGKCEGLAERVPGGPTRCGRAGHRGHAGLRGRDPHPVPRSVTRSAGSGAVASAHDG